MKNENNTDQNTMRLDKWLWCARFYKTRSIAADAVKAGRIRVNGERPKPAKMIAPGDRLLVRKESLNYELTVRDLPKARLPAAKAVLLYEESEESIQARELISRQLKAEAAMFPRTSGRPSKRDRRDLMKFRKSRMSD